jgi:hypothetical protein
VKNKPVIEASGRECRLHIFMFSSIMSCCWRQLSDVDAGHLRAPAFGATAGWEFVAGVSHELRRRWTVIHRRVQISASTIQDRPVEQYGEVIQREARR